jgi:hypothetical protein
MASRSKLNASALEAFERAYDITREDIAAQTRGDFLKAFPLKNLPNIKLDDYVIGHQRPTFCAHVEAKTRPWANIQGATSEKFGIYFGKTKTDSKKIYRFTRRFGETRDDAFRSVKAALIALVGLGQAPDIDFAAIDSNTLSQMFKAKILSLYFPDRFLNVCSSDHLAMLGAELGYGEDRLNSEYQHLLLEAKLSNATTRAWSNPKFMSFLYDTYVHGDRKPLIEVQKPPKRAHRKVNFEDVQGQRDEIGKAAETYALEWEKQRLDGISLGHFISKIEDRRDRPGYGYDFLSHTAPKLQRFIEVKSVGKLRGGEGHRFFLSDNEHSVSNSPDHRGAYFFYLVFFDGNGLPIELRPIRADELYKKSEMWPASYVVRFNFGRSEK